MSWLSQGWHRAETLVVNLPWDKTPTYAPVATALVALTAAAIACWAIFAQRDIARRRAAIDFFLKTEMDDKIIGLYKKFRSREGTFEAWAANPAFRHDPDYDDIRAFLNICELIAVGIFHKAFSKKISYAYWGDVLPNCYRHARPLIEKIRQTPSEGTKHTYIDLQKLCKKWS
jgi:hypothetical protein